MTTRIRHLHTLAFVLCVVVLFWAWFDSLLHLVTILWTVDSYSHGLLVPVIASVLIWSRKDLAQFVVVKPDWLGVFVVAVASAIWLIGAAAEAKILEHISLILAVLGAVIACYGRAFFRLYLFPFSFLFMMVPVGESLIPILQTFTAEFVILALDLLGVPFEAEGVLIILSSGIFEVARACAGIKFFYVSIVTGILLAHLTYQSWTGRVAIMGFAAALPLVANAGRVLGILLVAETTDPSFAKGVDHIVYGWGFLSAILIILIAVAYKFSDIPDTDEKQAINFNVEGKVEGLNRESYALLCTLVIVFPLIATSLAPTNSLVSRPIDEVIAPSCRDCNFRFLGSPLETHKAVWSGADSSYSFLYRQGADTVAVSAGLYCAQRAGHRMIQAGNLPVGKGWELLPGTGRKVIEKNSWKLDRKIYWNESGRRTVYLGYYINGKMNISTNLVELETALARLTMGASPGAIIAISLPNNDNSLTDATKIEKFLSTFPVDKFLWGGLGTPEKGRNLCVA